MDRTFDATPDASVVDADEREWRETEQGLDARHAATTVAAGNGHKTLEAKPPKPPMRVALEVDLLPAVVTPGYAARVVSDLVLNTTPQRVTLKLLTNTLAARGDKLLDGTLITRPQQALAWLLEQIAIRMPNELLDELMAGASL